MLKSLDFIPGNRDKGNEDFLKCVFKNWGEKAKKWFSVRVTVVSNLGAEEAALILLSLSLCMYICGFLVLFFVLGFGFVLFCFVD
jgi:hypothetical protein